MRIFVVGLFAIFLYFNVDIYCFMKKIVSRIFKYSDFRVFRFSDVRAVGRRGCGLFGRLGCLRVGVVVFCCLFSSGAMADGLFRAHRYDMFRHLGVDSNAIVFVGNSITDMYNWCEAFVGLPTGCYVCNRGVSGARTEDVLENIDAMVAGGPRQLFLMIGTNDLADGCSPAMVAEGVARIVWRVKRLSPRTEVLLQSILPSTVGERTLEAERAANELIRHVADTAGVVYVDLWDDLCGVVGDCRYSLDGLHLCALGYRVWCERVARYMGEGVGCVYADDCADRQCAMGMGGANGMRATYFSVQGIDDGDVLFFGDEMVKCGEWQELTGCRRLRNRGTGWGYDGTGASIATTEAMVEAVARGGGGASPSAVIVYTATGDVNGTEDMGAVEGRYGDLVERIGQLWPKAELYFVSLMPTSRPTLRIEAFNLYLQRLAEGHRGWHYVDIHTSLSSDGLADPDYIKDDYLYGEGYRLVAGILSRQVAGLYDNDYLTLKRLQERRSPARNRLWLAVSNSFVLSPLPALGLYGASRCTADETRGGMLAANAAEAGGALLTTAGVTMGLKYVVGRPRPYQAYSGDLHCLQPVPSASFPSGHTSFCFAAATSLTLMCPKWYVALPAYLWAGAVGFSRMYVGAHYPSDVISGALIGTACAAVTHFVRLNMCKKYDQCAPMYDALVIPVTITLF